jgi:hypothetical protein
MHQGYACQKQKQGKTIEWPSHHFPTNRADCHLQHYAYQHQCEADESAFGHSPGLFLWFHNFLV